MCISMVDSFFFSVVQKKVALVNKNDDGQFLCQLQKEFTESNSETCPWADVGLHSLAMFAWALTISNLRLAPTLIPKNGNYCDLV